MFLLPHDPEFDLIGLGICALNKIGPGDLCWSLKEPLVARVLEEAVLTYGTDPLVHKALNVFTTTVMEQHGTKFSRKGNSLKDLIGAICVSNFQVITVVVLCVHVWEGRRELAE